ncbi:arylsulfotransferase family protein [Haladaptatus cibarius]|uniref:arylsulfotransferase family protein n=1 Tax=Haladaptatus cibarius TaxID=453847 RepID=UPI00067946D5|nr:arylsulfotransferase family protein [Haladaptatus cibarius]
MASPKMYRAFFVALILLSSATVGYAYATSPVRDSVGEYHDQSNVPLDQREQVAPLTSDSPQTSGITVVAGHGMDGDESALVAFARNGSVLYHDDSYTGYFDVDPVPNESMTVEYTAEKPLSGPQATACDAKCTVSFVERVNLTTGERTHVFSRVIPQDRGANWHDVDRIDDENVLIGDIHQDQVYVVNTTTNITSWRWDAQDDFPITEGGPYPVDWAHLNDVERLPDGRYMASLRNQDQVVFLNESGLMASWTLGEENNYDILNEQHNPDYIPESRGGPAVIVADSVNDRVVEFQREDGEWVQSWEWNDSDTVWTRDADRLPNGHTLVADTNANRVVEVNRQGQIIWELPFYSPYDVERLGTGDESAGGPSATQAELRTATDPVSDRGIYERLAHTLFSKKTVSGMWFVLPMWAGLGELVAVAIAALALLVWGVFELRQLNLKIETKIPIRVSRETNDDEHF